jgi:hypothetical protein
MILKSQILGLIILFFISTTGLPITINLCKMAASEKDECMMHHKPVCSHCCADEIPDHLHSISFNKYNCCETEFMYKKVEDQYVVNKTGVDLFSSHENILHSVEIIPSLAEFSTSDSFYSDSSPPFLINPDLNITNSTLLI